MIKSRLTSKAQTTIPLPVRTALGLRGGDEIFYEIDGNRVILKRTRRLSGLADPFANFDEWASPEDEEGDADF